MFKIDSFLKDPLEKYQYLINNILDVIAEINLDGTFTYISPRVYDIFGYMPEEVLGKRFFSYIHVEDMEKLMQAFEKAAKGEEILSIEYRVRHKDGHYIPVRAKGSLVKINDNVKIVGVLRDISQQKITELRLIESENQFKEITEQSFMGICIIQNSKIEYINKTITKMLGYSADEIKNWSMKEFFNVVHPDDKELAITRLSRRQQGMINDDPSRVYRIFTKDGNLKWMDIYSKVIKYQGKDAILATLVEISDKKETENFLEESEEKYRELFNNMNSGVAVYEAVNDGEDFIFKDFNLAGERIDNVSKEDLIGKKVTEMFPGVKKFGLFDVFLRVWRTGMSEIHPIALYEDERIKGWRENYVYKLPSGNIVAVYEDVTERKIAEQKLMDSEKLYRMIFTGASDAIAILDHEKIIDCNDKTVKLFGYYDKTEIIGLPPWKISPQKQPDGKDSTEKANELIEKSISGESQRFYWKHLKKDNTLFDAEISLSSFKLENKEYIMAIIRDITERKKAERELREISQLKTELLERTSHELKTPLISIKGFTELLLDLHKEKFDDEVFSILGEIKHGTEQLETLINRLLNTSLLESGQIQFNPKQEDLSFLLRYCINNLRGLAETRNHYLSLNIPDKMILNFEKEKIYDVFSHLIINAIKYSPPYGEIKITAKKTKEFVIVCVQDNGIGLSQEEQQKIFKQFGKIERYGKGWDIGIEGTGMGLYTSKKIVELHGGKIWVESDGRNKGAKFCFTLPL
ncbi:MAG: PAS domain S-box protein [Candidatus Hermodarchaeota archaeon]